MRADFDVLTWQAVPVEETTDASVGKKT